MKNSMLLMVLCTIMCYACNNQKLSEISITDDNGKVLEKYTMDLETKMKQGAYTTFYPSGAMSSVANYLNDTLEGQKIWYFEDGKIEIEENYKKGLYHGVFKAYFEDGSILQEGYYDNNMPSGEWLTYYKNGQLKERVTLSGGVENGPFEEYNEEGIISSKGTYKDGPNEEGLLELFDASGDLVKKMLCRSGVCLTSWTREGGDKEIDESLYGILEK